MYEQVDYFADHQPDLGRKFMQEVEANIELLSKSPFLGSSCIGMSGKASDLRYWTMAAFPNHVIFYRTEPEQLTVVRILHSSRNLDILFDAS